MKKLFLFAILLVAGFVTNNASAQSLETELRALLRSEGYTIEHEEVMILEEDGSESIDFRVEGGYEYIFIVYTEDVEVNDLDIYLRDDDGSLLAEDEDVDRAAVVEYSPYVSRYMTVTVKNYDSIPSDFGFYTCDVMIGRR